MNGHQRIRLFQVYSFFMVVAASLTPLSGQQTAVGQDKKPAVWSRFRGPTGMGIASDANPPRMWSESENMLWKTPLPGSGSSSPIIWEDQIYVTSYTGYFVPGEEGGSLDQLKRHLIAIDRNTGKILWDRPIPARLPEEEQIRDHGFAASTPTADATGVYVFFGKTGVFAFDHQGNERWRADVGDKTNGWGSASSPLLFEDLVIVNASVESESLIGLDRKTGKTCWSVNEIREAWNTPLVIQADSGRKELVLACHGDVLAWDPHTGKRLWSCKTDITWYMVPTIVAEQGIVYCLGGRSGVAGLAIRAGGEGDVTSSHRLWTSKAGSNVTSPLIVGDYLYWMSDSQGIAYCSRRDTGEVVYRERLPRADQVYASPLVAAGRIYYLARDGRTFVLGATPKFELLSVNSLEDGSLFDAGPVADGDRLLIRSGKHLYAVGTP